MTYLNHISLHLHFLRIDTHKEFTSKNSVFKTFVFIWTNPYLTNRKLFPYLFLFYIVCFDTSRIIFNAARFRLNGELVQPVQILFW